jgi:hypothetical protein
VSLSDGAAELVCRVRRDGAHIVFFMQPLYEGNVAILKKNAWKDSKCEGDVAMFASK